MRSSEQPGVLARATRWLCLRDRPIPGRHRLEESLIAKVALPAVGRATAFPDGFSMLLDPAAPLDRKLYFRNCEPDTYRFVRSSLHAGAAFVDCGANVGFYTVAAATAVGPTGRVVSFEPSPETFERLAANVALNGLSNVQAHQFALGREPGTARIHRICGNNPGMDSLVGEPGAPAFTCRVARLDDVLDSADVVPDLIKVDVEGAELELLHGAERTLTADRSPIIAIELSPYTAHRFGYEPEDIVSHLLSVRDYDVLWPHAGRLVPVDPARRLPHYALTGDIEGSNYVFRPRGR